MVTNLALVSSANWSAITDEVSSVRAAIPSGVILKVIIESALWNDEQIIAVCSAAVQGGADFVKTSTGFHKSGGASIANVQLMRKTVGETIGVKASGGIRTYADAIAMIDAGATRIGASATRSILAEAQ
jgi:deoxyribose-phosphate aldolase